MENLLCLFGGGGGVTDVTFLQEVIG